MRKPAWRWEVHENASPNVSHARYYVAGTWRWRWMARLQAWAHNVGNHGHQAVVIHAPITRGRFPEIVLAPESSARLQRLKDDVVVHLI